jgi:hypothetical protein
MGRQKVVKNPMFQGDVNCQRAASSNSNTFQNLSKSPNLMQPESTSNLFDSVSEPGSFHN